MKFLVFEEKLYLQATTGQDAIQEPEDRHYVPVQVKQDEAVP